MTWLRVLEILLIVYCYAFGFSTGKIEGAGVCGCEFSCEAFRGSGATTCYIIYQEEGMWHHEEHSFINEEFLEQRECNTGLRQQCYMFAVYPNYLSLSCVDSHRACRRASGSIAKMDTNHELYDFSTILASNIIKDYYIYYSYKTIAGNLWLYNKVIKNTCADVQSLTAYGSDIQPSMSCQQTFKPVNSILCENTPLSLYTYCASTTTTSSPVKATTKPQPTPAISRKVTHVLQPKPTPNVPKQYTNAVQPNFNPEPKLPKTGVPYLPTWWPIGITMPTTQTLTKRKLKKKKMVVNHKEPHNDKKKKNNVTHLVTGIFFVGTILMVGFALLVGCFFRRRHDKETESFRWSSASEPSSKLRTYEEVDARNATSDHQDGYSVINADKRQNKRIDSVGNNFSLEDCRRYRLSKAMSTEIRYHGTNLHYQQDINARDASTYKTCVRSYDVDRTSSDVSVGSSRSSALYEIRDFVEYDYAYTTNNRPVIRNPYSDPYVVDEVQEPSYDYAYASSKCVKKINKTKPKHKRQNNLHGDV